jgi:hypothetical protein
MPVAELQEDLLVVHRKVDNHRDLIARGVDSEDEMG